MSDRPFILLTGDDSVRAEGIILVKRLINDWADFQIIATKDQMSGASSRATFPGGKYGTENVDGHTAIWLDGTPADCAYFASQHIGRPIDLVISGMNQGQNITNEMHRSGTVGAAVTASQCRGIKSIAVSMVTTDDRLFMQHDGRFNEALLQYPGELLQRLIKLALATDFPPQTFWNINFPAHPTSEIKVVPATNSQFWINDMVIREGTYAYLNSHGENLAQGEDAYELLQGAITITPCKVEYTDFSQMEKLTELVTSL